MSPARVCPAGHFLPEEIPKTRHCPRLLSFSGGSEGWSERSTKLSPSPTLACPRRGSLEVRSPASRKGHGWRVAQPASFGATASRQARRPRRARRGLRRNFVAPADTGFPALEQATYVHSRGLAYKRPRPGFRKTPTHGHAELLLGRPRSWVPHPAGRNAPFHTLSGPGQFAFGV